AARYQQATLRFGGALGDNVNDTVHRICAPDSCPWTSDHLDPLNVFQRTVLGVSVNPGKEWCVDGRAVDEPQQFVGKLMVKATSRYGPTISVDLGHIQTGYHAQHI